MNTSSRRLFLKTSVAGAVFSSSGILAATVSAQTKKWDETFDVIVVGSGFAGLAAAIEAKKAGANVIVLEKMPTAGGNSIINGGILTATGCPQQKKHNIEDSKELLEKDILVAGNYMNDVKKVHQMVDRVLSTYEWTVNVEGVEVFEGYRFPKAGSGRHKSLKANKGVIPVMVVSQLMFLTEQFRIRNLMLP